MTAQQLKNSILQMAVQGKLVPQDPNDEPASVLLERIKAEKEALIKSGKIKKSKKSSEIFRGASRTLPYAFCEQIGKEIRDISDEIPFEIPESWEWCRLDTIFQHNTGKALNSSKSQGIKMQYITTSNLYWNKFKLDKLKEMSFTENEVEKCTVTKGDLLVCEGGDIGRSAIWNYDYPMRIQNHIHRVRPYLQINIYFFYYIFYFYKNAGLIGGKGIGIQGLSTNALGSLFIPLPPLAEQKRIVAKIEELLPFIEKYEQAETKLTALNKSFPEMLKKSILQEAVQGKLVPQNPDDEPASILLEHIRSEKQELIRQGEIKKSKHESVIITRDKIPYEIIDGKERCIADEVPFEIPESWCWCKLSDIVSFIGGYAYNSSDFISSSQNQVLRLGNVKPDELKLSAKPVFISDALAEATTAFRCKINDILLTMTGTRKKRDYFFTVRILCDEPPLFINQRVGCFRAYVTSMSHWLTWILKSETILSQVFQYETGTANQGNLGSENIIKTIIPLPTLTEQQRIVEKIEELMTFCEKLK